MINVHSLFRKRILSSNSDGQCRTLKGYIVFNDSGTLLTDHLRGGISDLELSIIMGSGRNRKAFHVKKEQGYNMVHVDTENSKSTTGWRDNS